MLLIALAAAAATPSTADLAFMIGEWRLEGVFNPGTAKERKETGSRTCAFVMGNAYVRCDWRLTGAGGRARELASYHNYNPLYRRYEHLYIESNWPTKVIGTSGLARSGETATMTIEIQFALPDGKVEQLRGLDSYGPDRFESNEQMRVIGGDGEGWRTNFKLVGTRTGG